MVLRRPNAPSWRPLGGRPQFHARAESRSNPALGAPIETIEAVIWVYLFTYEMLSTYPVRKPRCPVGLLRILQSPGNATSEFKDVALRNSKTKY